MLLNWEQPTYQTVAEGPEIADGARLLQFANSFDLTDPFTIVKIDKDKTKHNEWRVQPNGDYVALPTPPPTAKNQSPFRDAKTDKVHPYPSGFVKEIHLHVPYLGNLTDEFSLVGADCEEGLVEHNGAYVLLYTKELSHLFSCGAVRLRNPREVMKRWLDSETQMDTREVDPKWQDLIRIDI